MSTAAALITTATELGATVVRAPGATVIVLPDAPSTSDDLVPISEAAALAKTSTRTIKTAGRLGALTLLGGQRDRTVRRADLERWIESRRAKPFAGDDDADIARRVRRLGRGA